MEFFIETVKSYPCLWDMDNPAYKDFEAMERAWVEVAAATNFTDAKSAKMQWKKLRDNFREALKRQKDSKNGSTRMWRYQQQMEFLIPYMQSKVYQDLSLENDRSAGTPTDGNDIVAFNDDHRRQNMDPSFEEDVSDSGSSFQRKKRKMGGFSYADDHKSDRDDREMSRTAIIPGNALLDFFSSMYNTTEELPPHLQIQVKRKIFDVVTEAEETALMMQQQQQEYDVHSFF